MSGADEDALVRPAAASTTAHELQDDVQIEPHGVSGLSARPAGEVRRCLEPTFEGAFWLAGEARADQHAAFVTGVVVPRDAYYLVAVQASGSFRLRVDGDTLVHGPLRYAPALPEYHEQRVWLAAGWHRLSLHAQAELLTTRTSAAVPPFAWVRLRDEDDGEVELSWRGRELDEYRPTGLRVSPLLGWVEWQSKPFAGAWWDDDLHPGWASTVPVDLSSLGPVTRADICLPAWPSRALEPVASGTYRDTYVGYELDDIGTQFLLADDDPDPEDDLDGRWFRYDLGRVRVGSVRLGVRASSAAEVTVGFAERLTPDGRPSPVVALSAGPTRMLQHFSVAEGETTIEPLQSLGGRYLEVRVRGDLGNEVTGMELVERDFLGEPTGRFESDDPLLNRIWKTGLDTLRATAEDSLIDSVRERGEWVGDVVSSALHLLSTGWGDVRLVRRALLHSAAGAREDGLVSGCGPGEVLYLGTYAAQWVTACLNVARVEGDLGVLRELEEPARANVDALVASVAADGRHTLPWSFVDWGYGVPRHQPNLAVVAHVHQAVRSWRTWQVLLGKPEVAAGYAEAEERLATVLTRWMPDPANPYHSWTLGVHSGVVEAQGAADFILEHVARAFPFDRSAARLRDPSQVRPGAVTPYFTNYSFPILLDAGHGSRVADAWRSGWGWMLERGATTWWEVFDERWSQCHYWGGAPTWQMSRWGLGLHLDVDAEGPVVDLRVNDLGLERLSGVVHLPGGARSDVEWTRTGPDRLDLRVHLTEPTRVRRRGGVERLPAGGHRFELDRVGVGSLYR